MQRAINTFKLNIESVKHLDVVFQYLTVSNVKTIDLSELLRAQIVLGVSALDTLISDLLEMGLVKSFAENRVLSTNDFSKFKIDIDTLRNIISVPSIEEKSSILSEYIRQINSKSPYQDPKQVVSALRLLGITDVWRKLAVKMSVSNPEDVKNELANIVWQRHKIAHEADIDYTTQEKRVRDRPTTQECIAFIENLCESIYDVVNDELG